MASAKNEEGEQLFPRRWDSEFIDLPIVRNQHQPIFSSQMMSSIVQKASGQYRVLYALLAASGLRIGEAFGLTIENISPDYSTIRVRQSVWDRSIQSPKTPSAIRVVDLSSDISAMLKELIGKRREGFVFENGQGKALAPSNVLRRNLHPLLASIAVAKTGFHSFRRFRATHLSKSRTPESLMKFWMGHAATSQNEEYVKLFAEVDYRKDVATLWDLALIFCQQSQLSVLSVKILCNRKKRKLRKWLIGEGLKWRARRDSNSRPSGSTPD